MHDVREILRLAKAEPPAARYSVEDIVAAGRRQRRRALGQRLGGLGVLAAAVATATVLSTANLALSGGRTIDTLVLPAASPPAPTTPPASPPFTFTFGGYQVDNYRVLPPDEVNLAEQTAGVLRDNPGAEPASRYVGTLAVYQPGTFNPDRFHTGARLSVQGRDAYHADVPLPLMNTWPAQGSTPAVPAGQTVNVSVLAWQYAPDAWAVLTGEPHGEAIPLADQLKIAERFAVATGVPVVAKVPFRTGYLPAGFTLQSVSGQSLTAENRGMVTFAYAQPPPSTGALAAAGDPAHDSTVTSVVISILWVDAPPPDAVKRTTRCNPGQHWCATTLPGGEFYVAVEDPSNTLSDDELLRVSDGLAFADIKNPNTWYPAA
jgi:hypothetical protein